MEEFRREFLRFAGLGVVGGTTNLLAGRSARAQPHSGPATQTRRLFYDVRDFGARGDGVSIDSPAVNAAIEAAALAGGGTVVFSAGVYACYSIRLKSRIALLLQQGATVLAAPTPYEGLASGGYDAAEPQGAEWEAYQDYGHNHWHNSLIWGEDLQDIGIFGPGLIWGKGLSRGHHETALPETTRPGVGNKAIALKRCRNVILSDFSILQGGWFGVLATGVDNLTIDNLKIDTNRDGIDIDCCRNVRVSNCTVNSPWDDGICPKSSFALGYARATENVTIANCFVTGDYQLGSVLDGTWKRMEQSFHHTATGRIKCGTESNGGFRNIAIANCVFESCRGLALETVDGGLCEDISFVGVTMRDVRTSPLFLRLGSRMRGPRGVPVGTLKRILISNVTSSGADQMPSLLSGVSGHRIEDVKISDVYLQQTGGADRAMAGLQPPEKADAYPEPTMFGDLPACGLFARHVRNLELSNVEIATETADARAAIWLEDVDGADLFRLRLPREHRDAMFVLKDVHDFRVFGCQHFADTSIEHVADRSL